jgi:predicted GIY-YIG superfamily endonuclease
MIYYIYKIVCNDVSCLEFYVGSTTCFRKRKYSHKSRCNNPNDIRYNSKIYNDIRENGGWDNWRMVILEEMIDTTKIQANIREEHYRLKLCATLNSQSAYTGLTKEEQIKQYKEINKEKIKEQQKVYREINKDHIKEYNKEYQNTEQRKEYIKNTIHLT